MGRCDCETATLLALHAALGQRWVCLPFAVLWVTRSVSVAYSFAGQFAAWAVLVLAADCVCAAQLVGGVPPIGGSKITSRRAGAAAAAIVCTATLIARCVPIVGPAAAVGTSAYFAAASALAARKRQPHWVFFAWALVETLLGAVAGCALYFTRTLYADKMDVAVPSWRWLVLLYGINCALGFASAVLQATIVLRISRASSLAAAESKSGRRAGNIALLPIGIETPDHVDAATSEDDETMQDVQEITTVDNWRAYARLGFVVWSSILGFFTVGWLATQLFPPGEYWPESPGCRLDCFCAPLAASSSLNIANLPEHHDANNNDGCAPKPCLLFVAYGSDPDALGAAVCTFHAICHSARPFSGDRTSGWLAATQIDRLACLTTGQQRSKRSQLPCTSTFIDHRCGMEAT